VLDLADHWSGALTIDDYVGQMWRRNRARFTRNLDDTHVDAALLERFGGRSLRVLVLTEHYCEDSLQLVPMLWRLADELPDAELRVLRQHEHHDLAQRYLTPGGYPAIPVFIVLDAELRERGALIERPAGMTADMAAETRRFQQAHPELPGINRTLERMPDETRAAVKQHIAAWRTSRQAAWAAHFFDELARLAAAS
jgi:hypothetical protein